MFPRKAHVTNQHIPRSKSISFAKEEFPFASGDLLLLCHILRLSSRLNHICFRRVIYSHYHWRNDRSLVTIVWHYWMIPRQTNDIELDERNLRTYLISDIVDNDDSMCSAIVTTGDRTKPFLTSCVPLLTKRGWKRSRQGKEWLTICNLIVFPSRSIVRIF